MKIGNLMNEKAISTIKSYHAQVINLQTQVAIRQGQILAIVELMGWDASTANGYLGDDIFAIPVDLPQPEKVGKS